MWVGDDHLEQRGEGCGAGFLSDVGLGRRLGLARRLLGDREGEWSGKGTCKEYIVTWWAGAARISAKNTL